MDELVRIYATADRFEGELMKGRLDAEGISVLIKGEGEGPYRSGPVYLWVRAEDEAAARATIDAVQSGAFTLEPESPSVHPEDAAR